MSPDSPKEFILEENLLHCAATLGMAAVPCGRAAGCHSLRAGLWSAGRSRLSAGRGGQYAAHALSVVFCAEGLSPAPSAALVGGEDRPPGIPRPSQGAHGPKISDPGADHSGRHPPPRTGAWTGALVATIFRIPIRKALPALLIGVLIAGAIVTAVSCGVISLWV